MTVPNGYPARLGRGSTMGQGGRGQALRAIKGTGCLKDEGVKWNV